VECLGVFFPHLQRVRLDRVTLDCGVVVVEAHTTAAAARCPKCRVVSARVHSRYVRRLSDTAIASRPTTLVLGVRKFFCDMACCPQRTFCEPLDFACRYSRRTQLATDEVTSVALALGGRAGARLATVLGIGASRVSLLRLIRRIPDPVVTGLCVLGVDLSRGRDYPDVVIGRGERPWGGGLRVRGDGQPVGIIIGSPRTGEGCRRACSGLVWCSMLSCGLGHVP